jgi:hypothetical protein
MQYGRGPVRHFQNLSTYERAAQLGGIQDLGMPGDQDKTKIIGSSFGGTDFEFHTLQRPKTPPRGSQRTPQGLTKLQPFSRILTELSALQFQKPRLLQHLSRR